MLEQLGPALVGVIEDNEISRAALGRLLEAGGFEPALFESAEEFLSSQPVAALRCLILDVQLTGMSGLELQMKLRADGFDVPIIMITGDRAAAIRQRAEQTGCVAFLWKPFDADTILPLLASIVRPPLD